MYGVLYSPILYAGNFARSHFVRPGVVVYSFFFFFFTLFSKGGHKKNTDGNKKFRYDIIKTPWTSVMKIR